MSKEYRADVKCDAEGCDWTEKNANAYDWHNKPCPKCGQSIIITDEEIGLIRILHGLVDLGIVENRCGREDEPLPKGSVKIVFDTAGLRKEEAR